MNNSNRASDERLQAERNELAALASTREAAARSYTDDIKRRAGTPPYGPVVNDTQRLQAIIDEARLVVGTMAHMEDEDLPVVLLQAYDRFRLADVREEALKTAGAELMQAAVMKLNKPDTGTMVLDPATGRFKRVDARLIKAIETFGKLLGISMGEETHEEALNRKARTNPQKIEVVPPE